MTHKIISKILDISPYEIVKIQLLSDNIQEKEWIKNITQETEDYLTLIVQAVEIIEGNPPYFTIKKVKNNIGF